MNPLFDHLTYINFLFGSFWGFVNDGINEKPLVVSLSSGHDKQNRDSICSRACRDLPGSSVEMDNKIPNNQASTNPISTPPPLCNLDVEVIRNLPPEVFSELNEIYGGKLIDYIANSKSTSENSSPSGNSFLEQGKLFSVSLV